MLRRPVSGSFGYRALRLITQNCYERIVGNSYNGANGVLKLAATLLKVMIEPGTPASTRVRAAESVLSHAAKTIEIEDIDARLRELEAAGQQHQNGSK